MTREEKIDRIMEQQVDSFWNDPQLYLEDLQELWSGDLREATDEELDGIINGGADDTDSDDD